MKIDPESRWAMFALRFVSTFMILLYAVSTVGITSLIMSTDARAEGQKLFEVEHVVRNDVTGEPAVILKRIVVVKEVTDEQIIAILERMADEGVPLNARPAVLEALTRPEYSVKTEVWERKAKPVETPVKREKTQFERIKAFFSKS